MSEPAASESRRGPGLAGYALVAGAGASWGAQSVVAKLLLTSGLPVGSLISARITLASLIVLAGLALVKPGLLRVSGPDLGRLAVLGLVGMAISNYTYYVALARIPVATAALVIYAAPLFVLVASVTLYGESLRRIDLLAAAVTLSGASLVVRAYEPAVFRVNLVGIAASLVTALGFAFYNLWAKTISRRVPPWTMLAYSLAAAALCWVPLAPPWSFFRLPHSPAVWAGLAVIVVFGTLVPFSLYLAGLTRISAAHASVTSTVEPVVAASIAFLVLGEGVLWPQALGGALVLAGIALLHAPEPGPGGRQRWKKARALSRKIRW